MPGLAVSATTPPPTRSAPAAGSSPPAASSGSLPIGLHPAGIALSKFSSSHSENTCSASSSIAAARFGPAAAPFATRPRPAPQGSPDRKHRDSAVGNDRRAARPARSLFPSISLRVNPAPARTLRYPRPLARSSRRQQHKLIFVARWRSRLFLRTQSGHRLMPLRASRAGARASVSNLRNGSVSTSTWTFDSRLGIGDARNVPNRRVSIDCKTACPQCLLPKS